MNKAKPSICHMTTIHSPLDARIFYREALCLHGLGHEVSVVGPQVGRTSVHGVTIYPIHKPRSRFWRMLSSSCRILSQIRKRKADIYHFHDPELLPAAFLAKLLWKKRVVFDAHEDVALIMIKDWLPSWVRPVVYLATAFMDRVLTARMDAIITPTRLLNDKYTKFAKRTGLFRNFPAPEFIAAVKEAWVPVDQRDNLVVHLGTLSAHRLEILLGVTTRFLEKQPSWRWAFIGLRPDQITWVQPRIPPELSERIQLIGAIPHMEVAALCCRASIGINYHQLSSQNIQRAIPLKVFEYICCGLCVLTTKVPLLMELVQECKAVRGIEESPDSLLEGLNDLAITPNRHQLCKDSLQFAQDHFNCEAEAANLSTLYHQIMLNI